MKLALIPPFCRLADTTQTDYQLMLPHLLAHEPYATRFYPPNRPKGEFVILDNGAAEGIYCDPGSLQVIGNIYQVDEIVLPDTIGDQQDTITRIRSYPDEVEVHEGMGYMAVVQGQTYEECMGMVDAVKDLPFITTLGIPRHLLKTIGDPHVRGDLVEDLEMHYGTRYQFHMLGASPTWTQELQWIALRYGEIVRGMDTSMPYTYAYYCTDIPSDVALARPENYFEGIFNEAGAAVADKNVERMLSWA